MASHRDRLVVRGPPLVEILNGVHYLDCNRFHPRHRFTMKAPFRCQWSSPFRSQVFEPVWTVLVVLYLITKNAVLPCTLGILLFIGPGTSDTYS